MEEPRKMGEFDMGPEVLCGLVTYLAARASSSSQLLNSRPLRGSDNWKHGDSLLDGSLCRDLQSQPFMETIIAVEDLKTF